MRRGGWIVLLLLLVAIPGIGQAEDGKEHLQDVLLITQGLAEHIRTGQVAPLVVPESGRVHDVLAVGNDVHIYGQVEDEVVVIHGNAYIHAGAVVDDKVVAIGGRIYLEDGARVVDGLYSLGADGTVAASLILAGVMVLLFWLIQLLLSALVLLAVPALPCLGRDRIRTMHWRLQQMPGRTLLAGLCGFFVIALLLGMLTISVVGIPFALLGVTLLLCGVIYGLTAVALEINRWFGNGECGEETLTANLFRGALLLTGAANLPIVGLFVAAGMSIAALGALLLLFESGREESE